MADFKNIKGGKELQAFLSSLPAKVEKNIMRSALRAGANVIRAEARTQVPVDSGALRKSLQVTTGGKRGQVIAKVRSKLPYAHLVEFGTAAHVIQHKAKEALAFGGTVVPTVQHPGAKAKPYLRPALDTKAGAAVVAVGDQVKKRLTKEGLNTQGISLEVDE